MLYEKLTRRRQDRIKTTRAALFEEFVDGRNLSRTESELIEDCEALYKGGLYVQEKLTKFLPEPEFQTAKARRLMLSIASVKYINLMASVVNFFPDFLFSFPLVFKTPEAAFYQQLKENCDGSGTDFQALIQKCFIEYLVGKRVAVAVTLPRVAPVNSAAEAEASGALNASLRKFGASEIMDWEFDSSGSLQWIILRATSVPRLAPEDDGLVQYEQYWVHTKSRTDYFEFPSGSYNGGDTIGPRWSWAHELGKVPVVLWESHDGKWLGGRLRNPCVDHLRARTALGFHNNKTAYPVLVKSSADNSSDPKLGDASVSIGEKDKLDFLVPPAESREALENDVTDAKVAIYGTANLLFLIDQEKNKPWRSAKAKESDSDDGAVTMKGYGAMIRDFAKAILETVDLVRKGSGEGFDVSGFEKLDEMGLEELTTVLQVLSTVDFTVIQGFGDTARKSLMKRLMSIALSDVDEQTKQAIAAEIEKSTPVKPEPAAPKEGATKKKEGK